MCGIMGYIGDRDTTKVILEGLAKHEYRGYDSAGIAVIKDNKISDVYKRQGYHLPFDVFPAFREFRVLRDPVLQVFRGHRADPFDGLFFTPF